MLLKKLYLKTRITIVQELETHKSEIVLYILDRICKEKKNFMKLNYAVER